MNYTHNLTFGRSSWFVRLYFWLWPDAEAEYLDTCRLFWGLFPPFVIVNILVRVIGFLPYQFVTKVFMPRINRRKARKDAVLADMTKSELDAALEKDADAKPSRASRILSALIVAIGHIAGFWQKQWFWVRYIALAIVILFAVACVGALGYGAYVLVTSPIIWTVLLYALVVMVLITSLFTVMWFLLESSMGTAAVKDFGRMLKAGFHGVHTRSCAKVDLR